MKPGFGSLPVEEHYGGPALPPTQAALYQHNRTAVLQTIIWNQATSVIMDITDFKDWSWHKDNNGRWLPLSTTLEDSSKACSILVQCYCVKSCRGNCKCSKAGVRCAGLCKCEGGCVNSEDDWFIYWYIDWLAIVIIVLISCFQLRICWTRELLFTLSLLIF